jgi:hypothetical protein
MGIRQSAHTDPVPKPEHALDVVQMDLKVCNVKSNRGSKYIVAFVDVKTGRSWCIPSPSNSAADIIRIFHHWKVQTIKNRPIGVLMTDNEAWATSAEWDNALDNLQVNQRKCGAYEHHQNGVVERRFRALNAMCGLYLDSTSNLDIKFWDYAYLHANENLQYDHQQGQKRSPMEKWQDAFPTETLLRARTLPLL